MILPMKENMVLVCHSLCSLVLWAEASGSRSLTVNHSHIDVRRMWALYNCKSGTTLPTAKKSEVPRVHSAYESATCFWSGVVGGANKLFSINFICVLLLLS